MTNLSRQMAVAGLAIATGLFAAGASAQSMQSTATSNQTAERLMATMPTDDRSFIDLAVSGDMYEIAASKIAKQRGVGGDVATFADQMIADHSATSAELATILATMNPPMAPPTEMNGKHRSMLQTLNEAGPGNPSTRAYVDGQRAAHNEAVALFGAYAQAGENPALRAFAQKHLPALQGHLAHIRRIEANR